MQLVPVEAVARAMRGLDRAALLAFVAETWAARGRETTTEAGVVLARDPETGVERRVGVAVGRGRVRRTLASLRLGARHGPDGEDVRRVDVVVTPDPGLGRSRAGGDVRVVGPREVRDLLAYGLPRASGERLARTHLDLSLRVAREPSAPSGPRAVSVAAAALVALALVAGGVVVGWPGASAGPDDPLEVSPYTVTAPTTAAPTVNPTPAGASVDEGYPPGLGPGGVENLSALLDRHREVVGGGPYVLSLTFEGTTGADGTRWARAGTDVWVQNADIYRFRHVGEPESSSGTGTGALIDRGGYADGEALYLRDGDEYERRPLPTGADASPFADRAVGFLRVYLGTNESRVRPVEDGDGSFRVVVTGRPSRLVADDRIAPGGDDLRPPFESVENYTAVAVVTRRGLVRDLRVAYERPDGMAASFGMTYVSVGDVPEGPPSLDGPPTWYYLAREQFDGVGDSEETRTGDGNASENPGSGTRNGTDADAGDVDVAGAAAAVERDRAARVHPVGADGPVGPLSPA